MVKRFPVQTGSWKVNENSYSLDELIHLLRDAVSEATAISPNTGILLSGGVDSTIIAVLINEIKPMPCITIAGDINHPDLLASMYVAKTFGFEHHIYLPNETNRKDANEIIKTNCKGDDGVYMALRYASHFVDTVIGGDGIDEQAGGYWWHLNRSDKYPTIEEAFQAFWGELELNHLKPMYESAKIAGVNVCWPYLFPKVVEYISRIPLNDRIQNNQTKYLWKQLASKLNIPDRIINRDKRGFVHALDKMDN